MCDHKLAPDNERVETKTAVRLGWYFCIRCGKKFPSEAKRREQSEIPTWKKVS